LNAEMADYFRGLRPRYRTAILSNAAAGGRREEQARYGLDELADVLVYSYEVGMRAVVFGSTDQAIADVEACLAGEPRGTPGAG
jgi:FMN phosphatase YigB (HAD superfamily)